jgi:hypothetical protein
MWWKPILGAVVVGFVYWKVGNMFDDYKEMVADRDGRITQLVVERNDARVEAESAKAALKEKEQHEKRLELLLADAIKRQDEIRKEKREQQDIFEGHDLGKMAQRHGKWIEKLANKATQERMDDLEDAFNR